MLAAARSYAPGLATAAVIAAAATFVSEHYGGPQFLYALFFGISFNFLAEDPRTRLGVELAARTLLRLGVGAARRAHHARADRRARRRPPCC